MASPRKLILTMALVSALVAGAVPARRGLFTVTQPDGTTLTLQRSGDEYMHFTMTSDGCLVTKSADGTFNYAMIGDDGSIVDTGRRALDPSQRSSADDAFIQRYGSVNIGELKTRRMQSSRKKSRQSVAQSGLGRFSSEFPRTGDINAIVILVQYKDVKFTLDDPHTYFSNLLNQNGFSDYGGTGCAAEYFREQSSGKFRPTFDLFGPVTLPETMAYYGGNDTYGDDMHPEMMTVHAAELLDAEVDFSKYDMDGDGYVDNIFVFYAGQGEASYGEENTVWPHSWNIQYAGISCPVHDGVKIDRYACSNEWESSRPDGVGTFVHEFSHVMGLPDLYSTDSSTGKWTPGAYSVMDYGPYNNDGRTPPIYSIYERNAMGWIEPTVLDGPAAISLDYIGETNEGCIIPTSSANEFFLIENRQQTGWDAYIPGHGMLIWHIDFNQSVFDENTVNNKSSHQYVDIEEANGRSDNTNSSIMAGYPFPGTSGKTSFTDTTSPSMKSWSGKGLNLPITDIVESADGIISFNVDGGEQFPTPIAEPAAEIGSDYFIATWQPVEGAIDYLLTVKAISGNGEATTDVANMGSDKTVSLPTGWSSTSTAGYSSNGNYGSASPSLKLSATGASVTSPKYDDAISCIEFWLKGQTTNLNSYITVSGLVNNNWQVISTVTPENNKAITVKIEDIPEGVNQAKLTYTKSKGNVAIDDITITVGGQSETILDNVSTQGRTSWRVNVNQSRAAESRRFSYTVIATDGEVKSRPSTPVIVDLDQSGVENVGIDSEMNVEIIGRDIRCTGVASPTVEIFDIAGRMTSHARVSDGSATVTVPSQGAYILRAGNVSRKLIVR